VPELHEKAKLTGRKPITHGCAQRRCADGLPVNLPAPDRDIDVGHAGVAANELEVEAEDTAGDQEQIGVGAAGRDPAEHQRGAGTLRIRDALDG
jgi:hypothetical protein